MDPVTVGHLVGVLRAPDRLPPGLDGLVEAKLRRLLRHAGTTVPWYRRLFAGVGIDPAAADRETLRRVPITRRRHWIETPPEEFHSTTVRLSRCRWIRSSGTTGPPVAVPYAIEDRILRRAGTQRCFSASGVGLRARYAWIIVRGAHPRSRGLHERIGLLRSLFLDRFDPPDRYWDRVRAWAPQGLLGCPLETEAIAARVAAGRLARLPGPLVCSLYGDPVDADTRRGIEAALGPVRELYGSTEGGTIAWECGQGPALHINADLVIVELLRDGRPVPPGMPGEVVITNLHSRAMPVIRYAQGDVGWEVPGPCPCGRPGPLMRVEPRFRLGPFRLPSGRRLSSRFFASVIPGREWLVGWTTEQPAADHFRIVLTSRRPVPPEEMRQIGEEVARGCWEPVTAEVECRVEPAGPAADG